MSSQLLLSLGDAAPVTLVFLTSHVKFYSRIKMLPKNHSSCGGLCKRVVPHRQGGMEEFTARFLYFVLALFDKKHKTSA